MKRLAIVGIALALAGLLGLAAGDAALLMGLTTTDPGVGVAAGFTYVFNAFKVP